jgi:subtilase family serine protease
MATPAHLLNAVSFANSSSSTCASSTSKTRQRRMPSRLAQYVLAVSLLLLVLGAALPSLAKSDGLPVSAVGAVNTDCASMAAARILVEPDEAVLTTLPGNVHPLARAEFDRGPVADGLPMEHIIMLLQRTPEQEVALQTRIDQMHNHRSPLFHQWLSPERVGACYGVADEDIAAVSQWLQSHGFKIDAVPAGKTFLIFSGTAGQVRDAFHTEIHNLEVKGEKHIANMSAPQIPAALAPVIAGFRSLHNFFPKPTMHVVGLAKRDPETGKVSVVEQAGNPPSLNRAPARKTPGPLVTYASGDEFLGPQDFYTIYNEKALLTGTSCDGSACNGAGQTIAVIEETDVCKGQTGTSPDNCNGANDLTAFEKQFDLPATTVNYMFGIPAGSYCGDPGVQGPSGSGEEGEADLDLQWSSTVAPGATVDFIACKSSSTTGGVDLAATYAVNDLAGTVSSFSVSYGICEAELPYNDAPFIFGSNSFYNSLWEQAVAQGQTVLISAGDSGDDTCDRGAEGATSGWNVNGLASTPFDVVAGGTDFSDNYSSGFAAAPNTYWNTNDTSPYESALSYIPETTWNASCGSTLLGSYLGFTPEEVCNGDSAFGFDFTSVNGERRRRHKFDL